MIKLTDENQDASCLLKKVASVVLVEQGSTLVVKGSYSEMSPLLQKLKKLGFRYDPQSKTWQILLSKITSKERKALETLINNSKNNPKEDPYVTGLENKWLLEEPALNDLFNREDFSDQVKKLKAKETFHNSGVWVFPSKNHYLEMVDKLKTEELVLKKAISEGWVIDSRDLQGPQHQFLVAQAKSLGGKFYKGAHQWYFPSEISFKQMLEDMKPMYEKMAKLAADQPELRKYLVPLLKAAAETGFKVEIFKRKEQQDLIPHITVTFNTLKKALEYAVENIRGRTRSSLITDLRTGKEVKGWFYVDVWDYDLKRDDALMVFDSYSKAKAYANSRQVPYGTTVQIVDLDTGNRT